MNLSWIRTILLAGIAFILLIIYAALYRSLVLMPSADLIRSDLFPLLSLVVNFLPFGAGLLLGLAAYNGPIQGLKFSVLNFLIIALLPIILACGMPTLVVTSRLLGESGRGLARLAFAFRSPMLAQLQPLLALAGGLGIGVAFIRGFKEAEPENGVVAASSPAMPEEATAE